MLCAAVCASLERLSFHNGVYLQLSGYTAVSGVGGRRQNIGEKNRLDLPIPIPIYISPINGANELRFPTLSIWRRDSILRQIPHCNLSAPAALYRLVPSTAYFWDLFFCKARSLDRRFLAQFCFFLFQAENELHFLPTDIFSRPGAVSTGTTAGVRQIRSE